MLRVTRKRHNQRDFFEVFSLAFPPLCGALSAPFGRECAKVRRCCAPAVTQKLGIFDALFIACVLYGARIIRFIFTNFVSAPTDTTIQIFFIFVGDYRKKPNSERSKAAKSP